jgi:hypothetical protein
MPDLEIIKDVKRAGQAVTDTGQALLLEADKAYSAAKMADWGSALTVAAGFIGIVVAIGLIVGFVERRDDRLRSRRT